MQCHEPGYEPNADGSACVPISCTKAVKQFVAKNKSYGLFDGSKVIDENGNAVERTYAIVADDISTGSGCYSASTSVSKCAKWECVSEGLDLGACQSVQDTTGKPVCPSKTLKPLPSDPYLPAIKDLRVDTTIEQPFRPLDPILPEDPSCVYDIDGNKICKDPIPVRPIDPIDPDPELIKQVACCRQVSYTSVTSKGEGLGCSKATTYNSIPYLMNTLSSADDEVKALQVACTKSPTIRVTTSKFPYQSGSQKLVFNGISLNFPSAVELSREIKVVNGDISADRLTVKNALTLSVETSKPNNKPVVNAKRIDISAIVESSGYSYNLTSGMQIMVPAALKGKKIATFNFSGGENFVTPSLFLYPETNAVQENYNTTVEFNGPSGYTAANGYGSLYVGTNASASISSRSMSVKLSGNFIWNLYKNSSLYKIILSGNSKVYSADYGTGNYSRIRRNNNSGNDWGYCQMPFGQGFTIEKVGGDAHRTYDEYNIVCGVDTSANRSVINAINWKGSYSSGAARGCKSSITSYCTNKDSSKCDEDRDYTLINCGAGKL